MGEEAHLLVEKGLADGARNGAGGGSSRGGRGRVGHGDVMCWFWAGGLEALCRQGMSEGGARNRESWRTRHKQWLVAAC